MSEELNHTSDDAKAVSSPSDTSEYLAAAMKQQNSDSAHSHRSADLERYHDLERYRFAKRARRRKRSLRVAIIAIVVALVGVAAAAGIYVASINQKLGNQVTDELRDELVETERGEPFYLLLLGVDKDQGRVEDTEHYGASEHAYRSDSIMLCRIDPQDVKVTMVSIHRDTLVNLDEGQNKINAAYAFGGAAYATRVISEFAGVPISHYAEIDLDRFITIVDQVGGVTVNLPVPVNDPEYTGLNLAAGVQTLDGTQAALLCRCRHGYDKYGDGDKYRAANQRMVFSEVIKKVLKSDPATIASTISTMADSVTTDMSLAYILELATQMQSLNVDTDIMTGMEPTEGKQIDGTWYEICQIPEWQKMMQRVNQGLPPYDAESGEKDSTTGVAGSVGAQEGEAAEHAPEINTPATPPKEDQPTTTTTAPEGTGEQPIQTYDTYDPGYVDYGYDPGYVDYGYVDYGYVDYGGYW